jgi:uncharacterized membrane protein
MKGKIFGLFFVLAIAMTLALTGVMAWSESSEPDVAQMTVYFNDNVVSTGSCLSTPTPTWNCQVTQVGTYALERGEKVDVKVVFSAAHDLKEVKAHVWMSGYKDDVESETGKFDVFAGNTYTKTLTLEVPADIDAKDTYTMYVKIEGKSELTGVDEAKIDTSVQRASNLLEILSVNMHTMNGKLNAGSTLYTDVVVKNRGNYVAEDVYVKVAIKELGTERTVYLGDIYPTDTDDEEDAMQAVVALAIPSDAESGSYTVTVSTYNDEVQETKYGTVVIGGAIAQEGNVEVVGQTTNNDMAKGGSAVYTIVVTNTESTTQNFNVEIVGTENWATTTVTPLTFSLASGDSRTVNVYVVANEDATNGEHVFSAKVKYGTDSKSVALTANVGAEKKSDTKTLLMIVGIVLAVIIIVLLILLLARKQKATETESYY